MSYGLPCSHIIYLATELNICLPHKTYNSCWNIETRGSDEINPIEEQCNNPIAVKMKQKTAKGVTREELLIEANELAKDWANTLTKLPVTDFQGQLNAMKHLKECAENNTTINFNEKIIIKDKDTTHHVDENIDEQQEMEIDSQQATGAAVNNLGHNINPKKDERLEK